MHPTNDLGETLRLASRAAYLSGANQRQIDMIVALAQGSGDYNVMSGGRLTKQEASRIIDCMVAAGAKPDWTKHNEPRATVVAKVRKVKPQAPSITVPEGARRVSHAKLGIGSVVIEDAKITTVLFDAMTKTTRVATDFLTEI